MPWLAAPADRLCAPNGSNCTAWAQGLPHARETRINWYGSGVRLAPTPSNIGTSAGRDGARLLVGAHLILSAGWAVVLFAAVMSFIGPKLERIARRHEEEP